MRKANYLPDPLTLLLIALTLFPARWSRLRSVLASLLVFGVPVASIVVGGSWVSYAGRYVLQYAVPTAIIVPVAIFRVVGVLGSTGRFRRILQLAGGLSVIWWSWSIWPLPGTEARLRATPEIREGRDASEVANWVRENVQEQDVLIDCAGLNIDLFLAPGRLPGHIGPRLGAPECLDYIKSPPLAHGACWLITRHVEKARDRAENEVVVDPSKVRLHGWAPVHEQAAAPFHKLWRYDGGQQPAGSMAVESEGSHGERLESGSRSE